MSGSQRTPLAWSLLVHDKIRLAVSVTGVAFAVFLMFIEMGFLNGVYDSQTLLLSYLNADLVVAHRFREAVIPPRPILRDRLERVRRFDGVQAVYPVCFELRAEWKSLGRRKDWVAVVGVDPDDDALLLPELADCRDALREADTALVDRRARKFLGEMRPGMVGELNGRKLRLGGEFTLGPDFIVDARLIMSDRNFVQYFPNAANGGLNCTHMDMGLVKLAPGVDAAGLQQEIQAALPDDIRVFTKDELLSAEKLYFGRNQPVGLIFGLGMIVGFVIGVTICYQILFTDVNDHEAEFATLKAIGYANRHLVGVVLREGVYLSAFAFLPGLLLAYGLYSTLEGFTGITMRMTLERVALVFALTVGMCLLSATLAVRKVLSSDPAEVF